MSPAIDAVIGRDGTDGDEGSPDESRESVLSDPYARSTIAVLARSGGPTRVSDLAREVAALITGEPPDTVPRAVPRRIQTWLHHGHLPALVEHGIVTYDPDSGVVRLVERNPYRPIGDR